MPQTFEKLLTMYGEVPLDRIDIRGQQCLSLDFRAQTGGNCTDETKVIAPPHRFTVSVFGRTGEYDMYTGEVRFILHGREFALVGDLTGREGIMEVTPAHVRGMVEDPNFVAQMRQWVQELAA